MSKITKLILTVLALLTISSAAAWGQTSASRITGVVQDKTGAVIPDATVTLTHEGTNVSQETVSSSAGVYVFDGIQPGVYTVKAEKAGFTPMVARGNVLTVGVPLTVRFVLEVGAAKETVEVSGNFERVQTSTSGNFGGLIDNKTLVDLPLGLESGTGGRNPLIFVRLQPGVAQGANTGGASHVNGARDRAFNYTLDGIDINETSAGGSEFSPLRTNPDSIQELRVITSNATAEFGRNSGAQVALVSKSGGNDFHGNLFYFHRNSAMAANEWENNFNAIPKGQLLQHQYGGSIGGPIRKNKTFFFFNFQGQRQKFPVTRTRTVYTTEAKQGLFRFRVGGPNNNASSTTPTVSPTGAPLLPACSGTVTTNCIATYNIVANDPRGLGIDPTMRDWFNLQPAPNSFLGGDGLNTAQFIFNTFRLDPQRDFSVKVDHTFNANNTVFVRYSWGQQNTENDSTNSGEVRFPGLTPVVRTTRDPRNLAVSYRRVFTPRVINELVGGFNHFNFDFQTPGLAAQPLDFVTVNTTDPLFFGAGNKRGIDTWQLVDNLSYTRGAHLWKMGFNFRYQMHKDVRGSIAGFNALPDVTFSQSVTATCASGTYPTGTVGVVGSQERFCLPGTSGSLAINTNDIARLRGTINDLLGRVNQIRQGFVANEGLTAFEPAGTLFKNDARYPEYDIYIQDTWKLRSNLTVDIGVRWEFKLTPDAENRLYAPDQPVGAGFLPSNTLRWTERDIYESDINNLSPSIGLAWDPWNNGKTSIRANYRQAFDRLNTFVISSQIYNTIPGLTLSAVNTSFGTSGGPGGTGGRIRDGVPSIAPPSTSIPSALTQPAAVGSGAITVIDPNLRAPKTHQWGIDIQREVGKGIVVDVAYIGRKAQNLFSAYDANQVEIFSNGFLDAFKVVAAGGDSPLINQLFGPDTRRSSGQTGSQFVRSQFPTEVTRGSVAAVAADAAARIQGGVPLVQLAGLSPFFFRAYPQFANMRVIGSQDYSTYHALQVQANRKFSTGVQFQASYTFSKSLDTRSFDPAFTVVGTGNAQSASSTPFDNKNPRLNYARSDFDRTHIFIGYALYDLPFGKGKPYAANVNGLFERLIGGWQINGILRLQSGRPFTVYSGANQLSNIINSTADCSGCPRDMGELKKTGFAGAPGYFTAEEIARFSQPAAGTVGNTGRNYFTGPGLFNIDGAILKRTRVTESQNVELRFEFFNVTNTPAFGFPTAVITSTSFGRVGPSVVSESRKVRLGVKYNF